VREPDPIRASSFRNTAPCGIQSAPIAGLSISITTQSALAFCGSGWAGNRDTAQRRGQNGPSMDLSVMAGRSLGASPPLHNPCEPPPRRPLQRRQNARLNTPPLRPPPSPHAPFPTCNYMGTSAQCDVTHSWTSLAAAFPAAVRALVACLREALASALVLLQMQQQLSRWTSRLHRVAVQQHCSGCESNYHLYISFPRLLPRLSGHPPFFAFSLQLPCERTSKA
jgi:hypothetical protein